jgi:glycosyltransferase involved in cell wall biosynthesis
MGLKYTWARLNEMDENLNAKTHIKFGKEFCNKIIKNYNLDDESTHFYAFNSAALELFEFSRVKCLTKILEQTSAPRRVERAIEIEASQRYPDWGTSDQGGVWLDRFCGREAAEWQAADVIVCPSTFVRDAMKSIGAPVEKVVVVPYGVDPDRFPWRNGERVPGPLRVLTVGTVRLQKGSPIVGSLAHRLRGVCEFRMVGPLFAPGKAIQNLAKDVELLGPVPRTEIGQHYVWADVFFLPSLCEGSATVIYEAMVSGIPVICSPNSGSLVEDGRTGFIVDPHDETGLLERFEKLASDPQTLKCMRASLHEMRWDYSFEAYSTRLFDAIRSGAK